MATGQTTTIAAPLPQLFYAKPSTFATLPR
jgi:hypothetical protein